MSLRKPGLAIGCVHQTEGRNAGRLSRTGSTPRPAQDGKRGKRASSMESGNKIGDFVPFENIILDVSVSSKSECLFGLLPGSIGLWTSTQSTSGCCSRHSAPVSCSCFQMRQAAISCAARCLRDRASADRLRQQADERAFHECCVADVLSEICPIKPPVRCVVSEEASASRFRRRIRDSA